MPIIKSAIKRAKQTAKRHERNIGIKHDIKDAVKAFVAKPTAQGLSAAHSEIDTAVKKGLIKKNTAARRKSALSIIAKKAGVKLSTARKTAKKPEFKATSKTAAKSKATNAKKIATKKPSAKITIKAAVKKSGTKK